MDICIDNVFRIQENYQEMMKKMKTYPKNEKQLILLKQFIAVYKSEINTNKKHIVLVGNFVDLLEEYLI